MQPITRFRIANYKSIRELDMELGRVNVLIGENGSGKSNILEGLALASCAISNKLAAEDLALRGIRVTEAPLMRCAFDSSTLSGAIEILVQSNVAGDEHRYECSLQNDNKPYSPWTKARERDFGASVDALRQKHLDSLPEDQRTEAIKQGDEDLKKFDALLKKSAEEIKSEGTIAFSSKLVTLLIDELFHYFNLRNFTIYAPQYEHLRTFTNETQQTPLSPRGEGLFKLIQVMERGHDKERVGDVKAALQVLSWFEDFQLDSDEKVGRASIRVRDRYIDPGVLDFDQRSVNEGFLYLFFYYVALCSTNTPGFFAIENIDVSLNPKLCEKFMEQLNTLAKKYDKQIILTTHNPAILDGLNLDDSDQRLFVTSRTKSGETRVRRYMKPSSYEDEDSREPVRLSEAFLRGYLGGLPRAF